MNSIDFGGYRSKVKVTMGIIDKCGVRGDATLCVVIFIIRNNPLQLWILKTGLIWAICVLSHINKKGHLTKKKKPAIQLHVVCIVPYLLTFCRSVGVLTFHSGLLRGVMGSFNNFGIILYLLKNAEEHSIPCWLVVLVVMSDYPVYFCVACEA